MEDEPHMKTKASTSLFGRVIANYAKTIVVHILHQALPRVKILQRLEVICIRVVAKIMRDGQCFGG